MVRSSLTSAQQAHGMPSDLGSPSSRSHILPNTCAPRYARCLLLVLTCSTVVCFGGSLSNLQSTDMVRLCLSFLLLPPCHNLPVCVLATSNSIIMQHKQTFVVSAVNKGSQLLRQTVLVIDSSISLCFCCTEVRSHRVSRKASAQKKCLSLHKRSLGEVCSCFQVYILDCYYDQQLLDNDTVFKYSILAKSLLPYVALDNGHHA